MLLNDKSRFIQLGSYFRGSTIISIDYDDTVRDKFTAEICEHSSDSVMEQEPEQQVRNEARSLSTWSKPLHVEVKL